MPAWSAPLFAFRSRTVDCAVLPHKGDSEPEIARKRVTNHGGFSNSELTQMENTQIQTPSSWIGIDICKAQLDLASGYPDLKLPSSVPNSPEGHRKLLSLIASFPGIKIIFEATGGYEKPLLLTLQKSEIHAIRPKSAPSQKPRAYLLKPTRSMLNSSHITARFSLRKPPFPSILNLMSFRTSSNTDATFATNFIAKKCNSNTSTANLSQP